MQTSTPEIYLPATLELFKEALQAFFKQLQDIFEHIMSELVCTLSPQYLHLTVSSMKVFKVVYLAILQVVGCLGSKDQLHQFGEVMSACIHLSSRSIPANIDQGCRMWCTYHRKLHRTYLEYHCCTK